ncbi:hypothetical protein SDC9_113632 [bioreactor metagenome]|uniref:Uncharacterized protein n=1 Tax=bioreactor metagenome TaxID=1076179 RepID=A0A645BQ72_9ZZZZ
MLICPSSVAGKNSAPTEATIAILAANIPIAVKTVVILCLKLQLRTLLYVVTILPCFFSCSSSDSRFLTETNFDDIIGTSVSATSNELMSAITIVRAKSLNMVAASPPVNTIGINTATVVSVEAVTAIETSFAPSIDAFILSIPILRCL